jgi:hypothetical protein
VQAARRKKREKVREKRRGPPGFRRPFAWVSCTFVTAAGS